MSLFSAMSPFSLLAISLALVRAEHTYNGPFCLEPEVRSTANISICDMVNGYEFTLKYQNDAGLYRAQLLASENKCWVQGVEIFLYQYALNESQCLNSKSFDHTKYSIHSSDSFKCPLGYLLSSDAVLSDVPVPKVNITYDLEMVYKGCYSLSFDVKYHYASTLLKKKIYWLSHNHTKEEFERVLNLTSYESITISSSNPVMTLIFQYHVQKYYSVYLYDKDENSTDITELCSLVYKGAGSKVSCTMPKTTVPGNYLFEFHTNAGFCNLGTFKKHCRLAVEFTYLPAVEPAMPFQSDSRAYGQSIVIVAVGAVACCTALVVLFAVYHWCARQRVLGDRAKMLLGRARFVPAEPNESETAVELRAILLVYARDCEPFMEAMRLLRRLLEERCGVRVYDIFDTDMFNSEVAASPHDWVVSMLSTPGVRVVLVKTPCGELLYETMMIEGAQGLHLCEAALPSRVQYSVPRYSDTLLLLLFRMIKDDAVLPGSYVKYFVVQISNFYGVRQLPEVNPYKRYELPAGVELLLAELREGEAGGARGDAAGSPRELRAALDSLANHVRDHPDYMLDDLLHVID